jgi:hypothetical protein
MRPVAIAAITIFERSPTRLDEKVNRSGFENIHGCGSARLDESQGREKREALS